MTPQCLSGRRNNHCGWLKKEQYLYRKTEIKKVNEASNYHPITFLPLTWKLLTGIIADEMYGFLEN